MELLIDDHVKIVDEHKQLLIAQVVLTDRVDKLAQTLDTAVRELKDSQKHIDERMNALISVVDGVVRRQSPPTHGN